MTDELPDIITPERFDSTEPVMGQIVADPVREMGPVHPERQGNRVIRAVQLHDGPRAKIVARIVEIYRHADDSYHHTQLELVHFRRQTNTGDFTVDRKFAVDGDALERLIGSLALIPRLASIAESANSILIPNVNADEQFEASLRSLVGLLGRPESLQALAKVELSPDLLSNLSAAAQHARFKQAAAELRALLADPARVEQDYQAWFELHPWVFGTEYVRHIEARTIDIESKADILLLTADGYVDLFELKTPTDSPLVGPSRGVYYASSGLSQALSQAMHYLRLVNENRLRLEEAWGTEVFRPRAVIVIGNATDWDEIKRQSWRNIRTTLQNIDLLTFDHVLRRVERLIEQYEMPEETQQPFSDK